MQSILNGGGNFGMGIGVDLGLLLDINKYIKVGLSVTDLGFMFYAGNQRTDIDRKVTLDVLNASEILDSLQDVIDDRKIEMSAETGIKSANRQMFFRIGNFCRNCKFKVLIPHYTTVEFFFQRFYK